MRVTWPAAVASTDGVVEEVTADVIRYRSSTGRRMPPVRLTRKGARLEPQVGVGERVQPGRFIAAVVPVELQPVCPGGADAAFYLRLATSPSQSDRYTSVKGLSRLPGNAATDCLRDRIDDPREHIYVRVEAAAGLMRAGEESGRDFLARTLHDDYLANRLEAAIILGEIGGPPAVRLLLATLADSEQHPEIRAGAAWGPWRDRNPRGPTGPHREL